MQRADGTGLIPAVEVLVNTSSIQHCIEDPTRTSVIPTLIAAGRDVYGMQTFDQCVFAYYQRGLVTLDEALRNATSPANVEVLVQEAMIGREISEKGLAAGPPGEKPTRAAGSGGR